MILKFVTSDGKLHKKNIEKPNDQDWISFILSCKSSYYSGNSPTLVIKYVEGREIQEDIKKYVPLGSLAEFFGKLLYGTGIVGCGYVVKNDGNDPENDVTFEITLA